MKLEEFELLIEVALAVAEMASPEAKRGIDRRINNLQPPPAGAQQISEAMVDKAMATFTDAINSTGPCERCKGIGYHHGFGEHGHDPDWCEVCGGAGFVPGCDDKTAMKKAIEAALSEQIEAVYAAYLGICVLQTMCRKANLTMAAERSRELLTELGTAFPFVGQRVAESALRRDSPCGRSTAASPLPESAPQ